MGFAGSSRAARKLEAPSATTLPAVGTPGRYDRASAPSGSSLAGAAEPNASSSSSGARRASAVPRQDRGTTKTMMAALT
jgi:hypothetical protein